MNTDQSLDNIVDMLGSINSVNEMAAVIRKSALLYYVDPRDLSRSRLRKIYNILEKKLEKSTKRKSDKQILNYLNGRIYVKQVIKADDKLEFEFYVTKRRYDSKEVTRTVNTKNITDPQFLRSGNAFKIDKEVVSISDKVPGDEVRFLKTTGVDPAAIESEFLKQFQEALKLKGLGEKTNTVVMGGNTFKNVGGIVKKPGKVNDPGADFVLIDINGSIIQGSGISHKGQIFKSYGGIKKLSKELSDAVELEEFIEDARTAFKSAIKSGKSPREVGFIRDLDDNTIRKILYKGDISYVVIGNLKFDYKEGSNSILIHGPGLYQEPQIPKKEYQPVLKSTYGPKGSKFQFNLTADMYYKLSDMSDMNPMMISDALGRKITAMQMQPVFSKVEEVPEIDKVVVAARLSVRLECVPRIKASSKRLKKI